MNQIETEIKTAAIWKDSEVWILSYFSPDMLDGNFKKGIRLKTGRSQTSETVLQGWSFSQSWKYLQRKQSKARAVMAVCEFWMSIFPKDYKLHSNILAAHKSPGINMTKERAAGVSPNCKLPSLDCEAH